MIVQTLAQKRIKLGAMLGRGGEATIYEVLRSPDLIAKIYSESREGYDRKLIWMIANPPENPNQTLAHPSIAWPHELLYHADGRFVGYLMPRIHGAVKLLEVFNPRLRAQTLSNFNWKYLHRTARNLASALAALHARDYIVGDLNESNILVMPTALVTLIDTDSFQVRATSATYTEVYPCPVARLEYTPPELQGLALNEARRPEHDSFGLGVLIFQMLMDGSHPFRGRWLSAGDPPPIEERIKNGWYPHASGANGRIAPLPNMLPLSVLEPAVADLLKRCFVDGHKNPRARPTSLEWKEALEVAEHNLVACSHNHFHAKHLAACPWCNLKRADTHVPPPPRTSRKASAADATQTSRTPPKRRSYAPPRPPIRPTSFTPSSIASAAIPPFVRMFSTARPALSMPRTLSQMLVFILASGRFVFTVFARWFTVGLSLLAWLRAPDWHLLLLALAHVARMALGMMVCWAVIGGALGAFVGLLDALNKEGLVYARFTPYIWNTMLWFAQLALIPAALWGALVEATIRYRERGAALIGAVSAMAFAAFLPTLLAKGWGSLLLIGSMGGGLFALASLTMTWPAPQQFALFVAHVMQTALGRLNDVRGLFTFGMGLLGGFMVSFLLAGLALANPMLALIVATMLGFVAGVVVRVAAEQWR